MQKYFLQGLIEHLRRRHPLMVVRAKVLCDFPGQMALVKAALRKSDCECLDRERALRRHGSHHACRVQSAAEERTKRDVAAHSQPDGVKEVLLKFLVNALRIPAHVALPPHRHLPPPTPLHPPP